MSASREDKIVESSVFFHFGTSAIYKFGASDTNFLHLRPNNLIMWEAIKWRRNRSFRTLSLGRTELENSGFLQFKRTWGTSESLISYFRFDYRCNSFISKPPMVGDPFKRIFSRMPLSVLHVIVFLLNRHIG